MKKLLYIFTLTALFIPTACHDWLRETAGDQITGEEIFEYEEGFQEALIGIYTQLASDDLYGKNLTWYFADLLAQPIINESSTGAEGQIRNHMYTGAQVTPIIDAIWLGAYRAVANVNEALNYHEKNGGRVLHPISRNLIKGELLALRAFIHFDLMRLYGYGNLAARGDAGSRLTIPYVTKYAKEQTDQLSYTATIGMIIDDLEQAALMLAEDPIRNLHDADYYSEINGDGFWDSRKLRMNYYAVRAALARVYMWSGAQQSAYQIAQELIALEGDLYNWADKSNFPGTESAVDRTFTREHIFTLNVYDLDSRYSPYMAAPGTTVTSGTQYYAERTVEESLFESKYTGVNGMYYAPNHPSAVDGLIDLEEVDPSPPGVNDYRLVYQMIKARKGSDYVYYSNKYYQPSLYDAALRNRIPLIKIGEMYLIIAEYQITRGEYDAALETLNIIRSNRAVEDIDPQMIVSADAELTKAYLQEFNGEGQLFFYLKRRNITDPTFYELSRGYAGVKGYVFDQSYFLIPYPVDEVRYGNRVQ